MLKDSFGNEIKENDRLEHTNKLKDRVLHYVYRDNWLINEEEIFSPIKVDAGTSFSNDKNSIWKVIK